MAFACWLSSNRHRRYSIAICYDAFHTHVLGFIHGIYCQTIYKPKPVQNTVDLTGHQMTQLVLDQAQQFAREHSLPYAGAVSPEQAFAILQNDEGAVLIDVRTNAERDWVGRVLINEKQHLAVQWSLYPGGTPNPDFIEQLSEVAPNKNTTLLFLCRSGVRSRHAAKLATEYGYTACYDILQGFEGDKDQHGHRKTLGGWCSANLPWIGA